MRNTNTLKWARWALGDAPPTAISESGGYGVKPPHVASMLGKRAFRAVSPKRRSISATTSRATFTSRPTRTKAPANFPRRSGYTRFLFRTVTCPGIDAANLRISLWLAPGFVVFAFDQIGNGARIEEVRNFYARYPHWSLLGKTVADAVAAIDALVKIPFVDAKKIWAVGFDTGGSAALHVAALDKRIAGVVAVGGFDPMRPSAANRGVALAGGVAQHWLPVQPRLAVFVGAEIATLRLPRTRGSDFAAPGASLAPEDQRGSRCRRAGKTFRADQRRAVRTLTTIAAWSRNAGDCVRQVKAAGKR
jgi:hypothetical protein